MEKQQKRRGKKEWGYSEAEVLINGLGSINQKGKLAQLQYLETSLLTIGGEVVA